MSEKIMEILADVTGGKSYKAHKYGLDHAERPFIDYGEDSIVWQKTAETDHIRHYVDLAKKSKQVAEIGDQLLTYFLDGSRRVFKVDDIAYQQSGRSVIYPVIAGQIGVGCCKRVDKRLKPEKFVKEIVLVVPDKADADGKPGFFQATAKKLNESPELKRLNLEFSTVLDYKTMRGKYDDFLKYNGISDSATRTNSVLGITRESASQVVDYIELANVLGYKLNRADIANSQYVLRTVVNKFINGNGWDKAFLTLIGLLLLKEIPVRIFFIPSCALNRSCKSMRSREAMSPRVCCGIPRPRPRRN